MARPSKYNKEIADKICLLIATSKLSIHKICENNADLPAFTTVFQWLNDPQKEEFSHQYARAREAQGDFITGEILDISDNSMPSIKVVEKEWGNEVTKGDNVERSRLKIEARKWLASKLAPKKYGDRVSVEQTNTNLNYNAEVSAEEVKRISKDLEDGC